MGRIDRQTVQRILDTADIVEVVSDFVSLKRRGANYIGLCPFHNERTPSFSVSKSKGICKCFSCGKGGSPVNFIMELEQMSYSEALRYLAKKYNIEIKEREMTDAEREALDKRESLLAVNDMAMKYFESVLTETDQGRDIGMAYFRERGINDAMIKRFHLGYSTDERSALYDFAHTKGFNEDYLVETGLCYRTDRGQVRDRFRGRVIYPVFTISGKVVAFGGRTLRKDKEVAKYVNSPESIIYKKSNELYGLFQAKQAIVKKEKCILVEGYMDVISMHQSGIENVVASSGTSLTEGQIRLIHRFTENVTVIYDSDPAGIKASLRGIDMLLAEGLNVKVLSLPEGDDPDSFAQSHSASEVERYLAENETDFIAFKTNILLRDAGHDPIERSRVISSIVRSISMIPDDITRAVYIGECSRTLSVDEKVLTLQVAKFSAERSEQMARERERERNRIAAGLPANPADDPTAVLTPQPPSAPPSTAVSQPSADSTEKYLRRYEHDLMRYVVRYGMMYLCDDIDAQGTSTPVNVMQYISRELAVDNIDMSNADLRRLLHRAKTVADEHWSDEWQSFAASLQERRDAMHAEGIDRIRQTAEDITSIENMEKELAQSIEERCEEMSLDFCENFLSRHLLSDSDNSIRSLTTDMVTQKHQLSKIHTKYSRIETERDRLPDLVPQAIYNLKEALIECEIHEVMEGIKEAYAGQESDMERVMALMKRNTELNELKKQLAKYLGERVLSPHLAARSIKPTRS